MPSPYTFADSRLARLDGFQVELDEARERADIVLDRPPLNVISMPQRDAEFRSEYSPIRRDSNT